MQAIPGICFAIGAIALSAGFVVGTGRLALVFHMAAASLVCCAVYCLVIRGVVDVYAPKVLFFVNAMAPAAIMVFTLVSAVDEAGAFRWAHVLFGDPFRSAAGLIAVPLGIAATHLMWQLIPVRHKKLDLHELREAGGSKLEVFLIFAAVVNVSIWVTVLDISNPIFYLLRILRSALSFSAFVAGLCAFRFPRLYLAWSMSLVLGIGGSLVTGGRGAGFIPIALFLVGAFFGAPTQRRRFGLLLCLAPLMIFLLGLSGFIGAVRDEAGRRNLTQVLEEGSILSEGSSDSGSGRAQEEGLVLRGLARAISWPPAVVPVMTPDPVPYRGFEDIGIELQEAFKIRIFELAQAEGRRGELESYYWGEISLKPYGFAVSATSSVEFGIASDGFTRGGWIVAFGYGIIAASALFFLEGLLKHLLIRRRPAVYCMMLCVLCGYAAVSFQLNSLVSVLRTVTLNTVFSLVVFMAVDTLLNRWLPRSHRSFGKRQLL